jgi:hypothetical protein
MSEDNQVEYWLAVLASAYYLSAMIMEKLE